MSIEWNHGRESINFASLSKTDHFLWEDTFVQCLRSWSRLQVHPQQQVLETRVVAEGVKVRLSIHINQYAVTLLDKPSRTIQTLGLYQGVDVCKVSRPNV